MLWKASKKVYSVLRSHPGERGLQKVSALYSYGKAVFREYRCRWLAEHKRVPAFYLVLLKGVRPFSCPCRRVSRCRDVTILQVTLQLPRNIYRSHRFA